MVVYVSSVVGIWQCLVILFTASCFQQFKMLLLSASRCMLLPAELLSVWDCLRNEPSAGNTQDLTDTGETPPSLINHSHFNTPTIKHKFTGYKEPQSFLIWQVLCAKGKFGKQPSESGI